jgi:hypothetical protein
MISLADISTYSILLPSGMVFIPNRNHDKSIYLIKILIIVNLVLNLFNEYYISNYYKSADKNNMFLFHFFTLCEGVLLLLYFRSFYFEKMIRFVFFTLLIAFSSLVFINLFFFEPIREYPSITRSIECTLIMILCLSFFVRLFKQSDISNLLQYSHYWMVSGFILYFAGTFFMNIVGQLVLQKNNLGFNVYDIHSILNIFLNIIYTIALWMSSRRLISAQ